MTSRAKQLERIDRKLGAVKVVLRSTVPGKVPMRGFNQMVRDVFVPGWSGFRKEPLGAGPETPDQIELAGQFSADGERHLALWEWLAANPGTDCLIIYTDLPDHSFNFGPREL